VPGSLTLSSTEPSDAPGLYGGLLMERLVLKLVELGSGGASQVYFGQLGAMPELQLGTLAAGESRAYRFLVTMLDGGPPSSPYVDDNLYQRASASLGYEWTLTEVEGGSEPEEPSQPSPAPTPAEPAPTPATPPPASKQVGTAHADRLIGDTEDDVIDGRGGPDRIFGRGGNDYLIGGGGNDWLYGGVGDDRLRGGAGADHLLGGPGADVIFAAGGGSDIVDCGGGRDIAHIDRRDRVRDCERVLNR
jgi:Ca2+-binding RTX toxin-like protein